MEKHEEILKNLAEFLAQYKGKNIIIACDSAAAAKFIAKKIAEICNHENARSDIFWEIPILLFNFALRKYDYALGIYIQKNGDLHVEFYTKDLATVRSFVLEDELNFSYTELGTPCEETKLQEIRNAYITELKSILGKKEKIDLKLVVDYSNGLAANLYNAIFKEFPGVELITVNIEPNGEYPHHLPDINEYLNATAVAQLVKENSASIGIMFDKHGEDYLLVDEKGRVLNTYEQKLLIKNYALSEQKWSKPFNNISKLLQLIIFIAENNKQISNDYQPTYDENSFDEKQYLQVKSEFNELLQNMWFTWNPHFILPIIDQYGDGWRKNSPPSEFLAQYGESSLRQILWRKRWDITQLYRLFLNYKTKTKLFDKLVLENPKLKLLTKRPIAYFCMEYSLSDWLQIYSGGLGVLAADYLKQASDDGLPVMGIGIFYHQGYFHQDFDKDGNQIERYLSQDPDDYPLELVKDKEDKALVVSVHIADHEVYVRAWKLNVGNVSLFLLDTNFDKNQIWEDRMITAHLYGGNEDTRIRQEMVLGIAGAKFIKELGVDPAIYHMNEGHSGFLVFEIAKQYIDVGKSFTEALELAKEKTVFTNHTLKRAGNDLFPFVLLEQYLAKYAQELKTDINTIFEIGKEEEYAQGEFSMTLLGLRNASISNAVSKLHGIAAKKLWPDFELVPVTNGVHMPTWVAPEIHALLDRYVSENWHAPEVDIDWQKVHKIPADELWDAHTSRKQKLINSLNKELSINLDPDALTIAWSRRLAAYKRPDMIVSNLNRLMELINVKEKPVQILIAGKAHPRDTAGKELLRQMNQTILNNGVKNKVVIIPGYNWQLARRMVSGADVWLNTPYRFEEASGTSGMKAAANGVLQLTTKDGWTDEVDWYKKGWVIDEEDPVKSLHDILEYQIIPLYYDALPGKYNQYWIEMMLNSMELVLSNFSTQRMVKDYLEKIYLPLINRVAKKVNE